MHGDLPRVGELHRVRSEVVEDSPEAPGIAPEVEGYVGVGPASEREPPGVCLRGQRGGEVVDEGAEIEVDLLEIELARLHLGEVEDVVDEREQGLGALAHRLGEPALGLLETTQPTRPWMTQTTSAPAAAMPTSLETAMATKHVTVAVSQAAITAGRWKSTPAQAMGAPITAKKPRPTAPVATAEIPQQTIGTIDAG